MLLAQRLPSKLTGNGASERPYSRKLCCEGNLSCFRRGWEMPHHVKMTCQKLSHSVEVCNIGDVRKKENGFSIVELLVVCVVIGIVASLAVPHLQKALRASENGATFATLRSVASTEVSYYTQNGRFARITEVNNIMSGGVGTQSGNEVNRGRFVFAMSPATPTDAELRNGYTVTATRNIASEGVVYVYELTQSGEIVQVLP